MAIIFKLLRGKMNVDAGAVVRFTYRRLMLIFLSATLFLGGCTTTIHEKKATGSDTGDITQLKFTGQNLKVVHDF